MKQMGAGPGVKDIERYQKSTHWSEGKFQNLEFTTMNIKAKDVPSLIYKQFFTNGGRRPEQRWQLPEWESQVTENNGEGIEYIWFGHSNLLIRNNGKTILIDPMFGDDAAPISPFGVPRFSHSIFSVLDKIPQVDLVLISHDHYDHLDYHSILKLKSKVKHFFVALGVGRHLIKWGIAPDKIKEFDWWDAVEHDTMEITFTPSRHFSGRGLTDRAKSLWGGWVIDNGSKKIWFSGDGGYGKHFETIGNKLGPFDLGFMECGQYNPLWHQIHMYPEEAVMAAIEAGVKKAIPVHWGSFALAMHHWKEPADRFVEETQKRNLAFVVPSQGELIKPDSDFREDWWRKF